MKRQSSFAREVALTLVFVGACVSGLDACVSGEVPADVSWQPNPLQPGPLQSVTLGGMSLGTMTAPLAAADAGAASAAPADAGAVLDSGVATGNDCCTASGSGGCNDVAVEACVCAGDPFCCTVEYDALCARQAVSRCGLDCDDRTPVSDCCGPSDVPGCTQPDVEACICDIDPFCCVFRFDPSCVNLGVARCGAACTTDPTETDESAREIAEEVQP